VTTEFQWIKGPLLPVRCSHQTQKKNFFVIDQDVVAEWIDFAIKYSGFNGFQSRVSV
jgi:hypothetical protein